MVMPGERRLTSRKEMPSCGFTSLLVRTRKKHQSAMFELLVQILVPFRMYLSPLSTALVLSDTRSEPAFGSEKPCDQITSPRRMGGRNFFCCASLPKAMTVGPTSRKDWKCVVGASAL